MTQPNNQPRKIKLGEFNLIAEYFAPLAKSPGALGLLDDGAIISLGKDEDLITTTDMLVSGVHFLAQAEPEEIATRLLAVNVSDLAAMGAIPMGYLLVTALTDAQDHDWLSRFAEQLEKDQARYGMVLLGGDTVATPGPLSLTLTAFGSVPQGQALKRSTAKTGDHIYVSGTIGDSALGLKALRNELPAIDPAYRASLIHRFQNPQPRIELGQALREIAHSDASKNSSVSSCGVADISDGLIADLGHICETSHVGASVFANDLPLSEAADAVMKLDQMYLDTILSGGDDYELVFTIPSESQALFDRIDESMELKLTCIGKITPGTKIDVVDSSGKVIPLDTIGYRHF